MKYSAWSLLTAVVLFVGLLLTGCSLKPVVDAIKGQLPDISVDASATESDSNSGDPATTATEPPEVTWVVSPWLECDEILPLDMIDYANYSDYLALSVFKQNGKNGLLNQAGALVLSSDRNVSICSLCGLVDNQHISLHADGSLKKEAVGHGGGGMWIYEINREQLVYYGEYSVLFSPEFFLDYLNGASASMLVPIARIDGNYSLTSQENYEGDVSLTEQNGLRYRFVHLDKSATVHDGYHQVRGSSECAVLQQGIALERFDFAVTDSFTACKKEGEWYFYDHNGQQLPIGPYEDAKPFHGGFAAVKQCGMWAYINELGELLTPFAFEDAASGYCGIAWAKQGGLWGVVDVMDSVRTIPTSSLADNATTAQSNSGTLENKRVVVTADGGLRMRSQPTLDSNILAVIPTHTVVIVLEEEDNWLKVVYSNQTGWVSSQHTADTQ